MTGGDLRSMIPLRKPILRLALLGTFFGGYQILDYSYDNMSSGCYDSLSKKRALQGSSGNTPIASFPPPGAAYRLLAPHQVDPGYLPGTLDTAYPQGLPAPAEEEPRPRR